MLLGEFDTTLESAAVTTRTRQVQPGDVPPKTVVTNIALRSRDVGAAKRATLNRAAQVRAQRARVDQARRQGRVFTHTGQPVQLTRQQRTQDAVDAAADTRRVKQLRAEVARRVAPIGSGRPIGTAFYDEARRTITGRQRAAADPETRGEAEVGLGPMTAAQAAQAQAEAQDFSTPVNESGRGTGISEEVIAMTENANVKVGPEKARLMFATWVKNTHPALYERVIKETAVSEVNGVGEAQETGKSFWQKITEGLTTIGTGYLSYKNQKDMLKLNIARAEQGLPPLDAGATAPVVRTQIDLEPEIADRLSAGIGTGMQNALLIGGAALLAIMLLKKK